MTTKQIITNNKIENKIYDAFFESQDKILDFVRDNYETWKLSKFDKEILDDYFYDNHKISCALMVIDDIQAKEVKHE
jgi:hypothetical protein